MGRQGEDNKGDNSIKEKMLQVKGDKEQFWKQSGERNREIGRIRERIPVFMGVFLENCFYISNRVRNRGKTFQRTNAASSKQPLFLTSIG